MLDSLNREFGIDSALTFSRHPAGLIQGQVKTPQCSGSFFLLGAHLASFQPTYQDHPVIFMSQSAVYEVGKAIRGGVPICFPWFGPHPQDSSAPAHGLVRTQLWTVAATRKTDEQIEVDLRLDLANFRLLYRIAFGQQLNLSINISNVSFQVQRCELALHSYFQISQLSQVQIHGLETIPYFDKVSGCSEPPSGHPILFSHETDRIYSGAAGPIVLSDLGWQRKIRLLAENSRSTIVWNPGTEKSKRLADFGDLEYLKMCCIETANVGQNAMQLASGESATVGVEISVPT
jgi:glucose-6-phosphate 1-epimerase